MIPLRRCGSNAIRLRLDQHPNLFCPYPLHLVDLDESIYGNLEEDESYFSLITDIIHLQAQSLVPWKGIAPFEPSKIFQALKDQKPRSKTKVYSELLIQAGNQQNQCSFVMDKSQDSVKDWKEWKALYPEIRFLDIVRDPRAQISSMNEAVIYDYETSLNCLRWIQSRRWVDEIYTHCPDQILTIRFEDFIADENTTLKRIFDFFEVDTNTTTNIFISEEAKSMAERSPLWSSNYSAPEMSVLEKYKSKLSSSEIEHIESSTISYMVRYGYKRETPCRSLLPYSISKASQISKEKEKKIWENLRKNHNQDYVLRKRRKLFLKTLSNSP